MEGVCPMGNSHSVISRWGMECVCAKGCSYVTKKGDGRCLSHGSVPICYKRVRVEGVGREIPICYNKSRPQMVLGRLPSVKRRRDWKVFVIWEIRICYREMHARCLP